MATTYRTTNTNKGGLTNQCIARAAGGGRNAQQQNPERSISMGTEAMYGGRDVACTMSRTSDRTSCRMPGSVRQSMLAGAIHPDDIAYHADSTGSVYGRRLKEINDTLFWRKRIWELYNVIKEDYKT
ncbi:hypothetical protein DRN77_00795 [Methanosarcinales archaeon]|nr:MAG: hypothetical protein DRN77_00795 [Methanosarcinales archaeon]